MSFKLIISKDFLLYKMKRKTYSEVLMACFLRNYTILFKIRFAFNLSSSFFI